MGTSVVGEVLPSTSGETHERRNVAGTRRRDSDPAARVRQMRRFPALVALFAAVVSAVVVSLPQQQPAIAATPMGTHGNRIVSETAPVSWTPHVNDGYVQAIAEVGNLVIAGGNFSTVENPNRTQQFARNHIFAFEKGTGVISATFVPEFNGEVTSIVPTGDGQSVFIAGGFNTINGETQRGVVRVNIFTGQRVTQFKTPSFNGRIHDMALRGDRLYVAGRFTTINNQPHTLVAALDPVTGNLVPDVKIDIAVPRPNRPGSTLSVGTADVTPDGSKMIIAGNFTEIDGLPRYQIGMLDLTTSPISVTDWRTTQYDDGCSGSFWSYMRDVEFSPDGSFFVAVTTGAFGGGYASRTLCDTSARWETGATGNSLLPTWVNYTGGDTLLATAIGDSVVYQGGHERRVNNPYGSDRPGRGSVWVEGISAVDPRGGGTFSWAPGRDRGVGVYTLKVTQDGLWVGSDTTRIARWNYRGRIALLPISSGSDLPDDYTGSLPGTVYSLGSDAGSSAQQNQLVARAFDGTTVGATQIVPTGELLRNTRGAFMVDGKLYTAWDENGNRSFRVQTFDGEAFGSPETINLRMLDGNNPSGCPSYPNVNEAPGTASCNQVNATTPPNIPNFGNFDIPNAKGMFYDAVTGRLYYNSPQYTWVSGATRTSPPSLAYRSFSTESNILGAVRYNTVGNMAGLDWTNVRSMFLAGSDLYVADTSGTLTRWTFDHWAGAPVAGTNVAVSGPGIDGQNWRARDAFVYVGENAVVPNVAPSASASVECTAGACVFSAVGSVDPDGSIVSYAWNFGNGTDVVVTSELSVKHTYLVDGQYDVTLTVTDDQGATGTAGIVADVVIPNVVPTAVIVADGTGFDFSFGAAGSVDPDGSIVSYTWDFGDGSAPVTVAVPDPVAHTYASPGDFVVTLSVVDDDGGTGTAQVSVTAFDPDAVATVAFGAVASVNVNSSQPAVTVPGSVQVGDLLVLIGAFNSNSTVVTGPVGWTLLDSAVNSTASSQTHAWTKVATAADAGSAVQLSLSALAKTSLQLASYGAGSAPGSVSVGEHAVVIDTSTNTERTTPAVTVTVPGSVVVSFWSDKSSDNTGWTVPANVTLRDLSVGSGGGRIVAAFADNGPLAPGLAGGNTAVALGAANRRGITWSIVIQPPA